MTPTWLDRLEDELRVLEAVRAALMTYLKEVEATQT